MAKNKTTVAIMGEGITEKYYIQSLRDILRIKPTPIKPKNSSLKELEIAIKICIKRGYNRVYCMIDMDNKVKDGNPDHERNAEEYAKLRRQYHNKDYKNVDGSKTLVLMIESFPSTELFFLYYFGYTSAHHTNQQLKNILNRKFGYLTEEKYLIRNSLHDSLIQSGGSLNTAILASEQSNLYRSLEERNIPYTEIGLMIRDMQPINIEQQEKL